MIPKNKNKNNNHGVFLELLVEAKNTISIAMSIKS